MCGGWEGQDISAKTVNQMVLISMFRPIAAAGLSVLDVSEEDQEGKADCILSILKKADVRG